MIVLNPEHRLRSVEAQQRAGHEGIDLAIGGVVVGGDVDEIGPRMTALATAPSWRSPRKSRDNASSACQRSPAHRRARVGRVAPLGSSSFSLFFAVIAAVGGHVEKFRFPVAFLLLRDSSVFATTENRTNQDSLDSCGSVFATTII